VWVDFCPVAGASPGTFEKAVISGATATAGGILTVAGNTRGFYVTTNSSTVTATLGNAVGQFNWCAYGSDYPPNVLANTNSSYTLAGTLPFILIASNGATSLTVPGTTIATSAVTFTPATITDATGYPGLWCPYTGSDLYMDASHRCMERQSGAGNWEAWIKDARDSELYRIVLMSDNKWWLAQNLNYNYSGSMCPLNSTANCNECGRMWHITTTVPSDICPNGWSVPTVSELQKILPNNSNANLMKTTDWTNTNFCGQGNDYYGFSLKACGFCDNGHNCAATHMYKGFSAYVLCKELRQIIYTENGSNTCLWALSKEDNDWGFIRCFRQL
jgi:uncharacterized protein (TIGR02145 family)